MTLPERLGKYRITAVLGEGAMGVVYKGFDPGIERTVALKTIRRHLTDSSETGASTALRFRNEAQAAGRLQHAGIVGVYDYGDEGDIAYIAMEYVEGSSLARYLASDVRFAEDDVVSITVQLLDALDHAHSHGVWHRDIKPANLLLTQEGRLKIADFGIARIASVQLTQVTSIVGTPGYMAPEQFLGRNVDQRVDLYAAGVMLYQLLVGKPPFTGTIESLMYRVVNEPPLLPSAVPGYQRGAAYDAVLAKALAKDPAQRFDSAAAFRQALMAAVGRPVPGRVSGDTIISPRAAPAPVGEASAARRSPVTASHWDPVLLSQVEATLARHVGPLAGVLVRRTARDCSDLPTLYARLAEQVTNPAARNAFMAQAGGRGTGATTPPPTTGGVAVKSEISDTLLAQSTKLLALHAGPIAGVVARRAAAKAPSREAYFAALEETVSDPAARARLHAELIKLPK